MTTWNEECDHLPEICQLGVQYVPQLVLTMVHIVLVRNDVLFNCLTSLHVYTGVLKCSSVAQLPHFADDCTCSRILHKANIMLLTNAWKLWALLKQCFSSTINATIIYNNISILCNHISEFFCCEYIISILCLCHLAKSWSGISLVSLARRKETQTKYNLVLYHLPSPCHGMPIFVHTWHVM